VGFAPWDDRLLLYGEDAKQVHLRYVPPLPPLQPDARHGGAGPLHAQPPHQPSGDAGGAAGGGSAARGRGAAAAAEHSAQDEQLAGAPPGVQLLRLPVDSGSRVHGE
jgi:hypothetical protein